MTLRAGWAEWANANGEHWNSSAYTHNYLRRAGTFELSAWQVVNDSCANWCISIGDPTLAEGRAPSIEAAQLAAETALLRILETAKQALQVPATSTR